MNRLRLPGEPTVPQRVLAMFPPPPDTLETADVRERTGFNRDYVHQILSRLNRAGKIVRTGNGEYRRAQ